MVRTQRRAFFFFNNQMSFYFLKEKTNMLNLSSIYNYNLLSFFDLHILPGFEILLFFRSFRNYMVFFATASCSKVRLSEFISVLSIKFMPSGILFFHIFNELNLLFSASCCDLFSWDSFGRRSAHFHPIHRCNFFLTCWFG